MTASDVAAVVSVFKDGLTGIAAVVAASVAVAGLKTWKRQLHGNVEYDLARRLLGATYKFREAINFVRAPFIPPGEMEKALDDAGLKDAPKDEREKRAQEAVYQARWKLLVQARVEFDAELLEAEALWGPEMQRLGIALKQCMGELLAALQRYFSQRMPNDPARFEALHDVVFGSEDDEYTKKLQGAITAIENSLDTPTWSYRRFTELVQSRERRSLVRPWSANRRPLKNRGASLRQEPIGEQDRPVSPV